MFRTTFVNKNGDVIRDPFYPNANHNNNQRRMCRLNNGQGRNNMVVADFGNRLYLRRIIETTDPGYPNNIIVKLDDILSVGWGAFTELY